MRFGVARQVTVNTSSSFTAFPSFVRAVSVYAPSFSVTSMEIPLTMGREPALKGTKPPSYPATKACTVSFSSPPVISRLYALKLLGMTI